MRLAIDQALTRHVSQKDSSTGLGDVKEKYDGWQPACLEALAQGGMARAIAFQASGGRRAGRNVEHCAAARLLKRGAHTASNEMLAACGSTDPEVMLKSTR